MVNQNSIDVTSSVSEVIKAESRALQEIASCSYNDLEAIVDKIAHCSGRIIFIGVGKSGIISKKISATFNSLGIKSMYLYASELLHGDLGAIDVEDIAFIISKSGRSQEIINAIPFVKRKDTLLIGLTSNEESYLAMHADYKIVFPELEEADDSNLVPTSSSTAQLAMGDAIALTVARIRGFNNARFAESHPGGSIGKKLTMKVEDLMIESHAVSVKSDAGLKNIIYTISSGRVGACAVIDDDNNVIGIITDGDLRRMLDGFYHTDIVARELMTEQPKSINPEVLAIDALKLMEENMISQLLVVEGNEFKGIIHIHDCLREGLND